MTLDGGVNQDRQGQSQSWEQGRREAQVAVVTKSQEEQGSPPQRAKQQSWFARWTDASRNCQQEYWQSDKIEGWADVRHVDEITPDLRARKDFPGVVENGRFAGPGPEGEFEGLPKVEEVPWQSKRRGRGCESQQYPGAQCGAAVL